MAKGAGREQGALSLRTVVWLRLIVCCFALLLLSVVALVLVCAPFIRILGTADKSAAQEVSVKRAEEQQERLQKFQEKLQQERKNKQEARLKLAQQSQSENAEKKAAIDEQIKRSERR